MMIPYGRQDISEDDINSVIDVLSSDFLTQGPQVPQFEKAISQYCGVNYAVAVNSATSALHIACLALHVGTEDIVWTSPITFAATSNAALYCGAKVDFVDIDPLTFNISVGQLNRKLERTPKNLLPKVVIAVHIAGQSCEMEEIHKLGQEYGFKIIEDASHAIGARHCGSPVGSCKFSDITVFSFHPVKIITTAEGGVATTNDKALFTRMELLRSHGITRNEAFLKNPSHGPWYYEQIDLGFNYRMTELQAALGTSQLKRLDEFTNIRNKIAQRYNSELKTVELPKVSENNYSSFHLYIIQVRNPGDHLAIFNELRDKGIGVNLHYIPVYKHPYYERLGFRDDYCPQAEAYYRSAISLPIYSRLRDTDQQKIISAVNSIKV